MRFRHIMAVLTSLVLVIAGGCSVHGKIGQTLGAGPLTPYRSHGVVVADAAGLVIKPGQEMVFDVYVVNQGSGDRGAVVVDRARLIPVPGHRAPRLANVGLERGKNAVGVQRGWPPSDVPVVNLIGASLPHGLAKIAVGITARSSGSYPAQGIELDYRANGHAHQAKAYGGAIACVAVSKAQRTACLDQDPEPLSSYIHDHT